MRRLAALLIALPAALPLPAAAATLSVEVEGVAPGDGAVRIAVCSGGLDEAACPTGRTVAAAGTALSVTFPDLAPGTYAVAAFQDLDGSGRLERTALGLPMKPFGLSNGAGRRGRPDFAAAAFALGEPGGAVRVHLRRGVQGRPAPVR